MAFSLTRQGQRKFHPMTILAFGINHKTAPVDIRERVAFVPERLPDALHALIGQQDVNEAVILSTCNRTDLYCGIGESGEHSVRSWFQEFHHLNTKELTLYSYSHPDAQAIRHILRVASGLDSLVLGEPQILGQMKHAYQLASTTGATGYLLNRLFQHTFSVAKQVRTDTAIGSSPVSVAFAAVNLSKQIFSDLSRHTALLIGAGKMIDLVARHLHESGIGHLIVANRTLERACDLADEFNGQAIGLGDIPSHLAQADIVITSTAAPLPILGKGAAESAIKARKRRPVLMVDVAVPRDIEPEVGTLDDVYLYTVDDLRGIIDEGLQSRQEAARQAEDIIAVQTEHFMGWMRSRGSVDLIRDYRDDAKRLRDMALDNALRHLRRGEDPEHVMRELARQLTNKLLHNPCDRMRQASSDGHSELIEAARHFFNLKTND